MTKPNVLVMWPVRPIAQAQLETAYTLFRYDEAEDKPGYLAEYGPLCEAAVVNGHVTLTRDMLDHLPNVKGVACSSAGFDKIDVRALRDRGIWFTNTSQALRNDVADMAVLLTLATCRQLIATHEHVRSGAWGRSGPYPLLRSLAGQRIGIVGLGNIGSTIAKRFEGFAVDIGYTDVAPKDVPYTFLPDLMALATWADVLIVMVPGGAATRNLIDRPVMEAIGPTGTLINISRGEVVDEPALTEALKSGKLGSAGLDVYHHEPNPSPALTALPNVTLSPHHSSGTVESRDAMHQLVVDNLAAHFAGMPLLTPVYRLP